VSEKAIPSAQDSGDVQLWEPRRALRRVDPVDARLSRGFLRCHPEKWFPGFAAHWMPVTHALGCEVRLAEVKPVMARPMMGDLTFVGSVDGELMLLNVDPDSGKALADEFLPGGAAKASQAAIEYLMRRLLATLALSWSGPESSTVRFESEVDPSEVSVVASVRVCVNVNAALCTVMIGLGQKMVDKFDGLWRRQIHSSARVPQGSSSVRLELGQLAVPPQMLSDYLTKGTVIDLEVRASDSLTLRMGNRPWMAGRLVDVGGVFGCEMTPGAIASPAAPEGTTRLSIELGTAVLESQAIAELGQPGAVLVTDIPVSERVILSINQEKVGEGRLCVYEGRFALEVQ
jgi:flagellar motor switch/type III secretory pathway protein FliN